MAQFPLYSTRGEWKGMLVGDDLYNSHGEWIGWRDEAGNVYSSSGEYVGWLTKDYRVLRKRVFHELAPRRRPPHRPRPGLQMPTHIPLAPLMAELSYDVVDVFDELPELLVPPDLDQLPDLD
jgi:hypothetical protein